MGTETASAVRSFTGNGATCVPMMTYTDIMKIHINIFFVLQTFSL